MKTKWMVILSALVAASLLLAPAAPVAAQDDVPPPPDTAPAPAPDAPPDFVIEDEVLWNAGLVEEDGLYRMQGAGLMPEETEVDAAASYSSPDAFGYRYQKVTPAWVDASGGTPVEIEYSNEFTEVELPFAFRFYGRSYNYVSVSQYGYLHFGDPWTYVDTQSPIGVENNPNAVVAPYWAPMNLGEIFMLSGGVAPNRWVAFAWLGMTDAYSDAGGFNFEVLLYENGQMLFQYDLMEYAWGGWYCGTAGIEDRTGLVSKTTLKFCYQQASDKAIKFFPPKPAARVWLYPAYYGDLALPGETVYHEVFVENNGDLGADIFDLALSSKWPGRLFYLDEDSWELVALTDTDGDKKIDTGLLEEGQSFQILVEITVPLTAKVGYRLESTLKITSSLNKGKSKTARIYTAVPVNFAQLVDDPYNTAISVYAPAGSQRIRPSNQDIQYQDGGVIENATGRLFYFGSQGRCIDEEECDVYVHEIRTAVYEHNGTLVGEQTVNDLSAAIEEIYSLYPTAAAAPDGTLGFAWEQNSYDEAASDDLGDVYFAPVSADGAPLAAPVNLTNTTDPYYYNEWPEIAATNDGKFVIVWNEFDQYNYVNSVRFAVVNPDGSLVYAPETLADGEDNYPSDVTNNQYATVTSLADGNTLVTWAKSVWKYKTRKTSYYLEYAVINSAGAVLKRSSIATGSASINIIDAAQMSGGQIVLAWEGYSGNKSKIFYTILSGTTYKKTKGATALNSSSSLKPGMDVSVTVDALNHAVLTWASTGQQQLYYAVLGKNGAILTKPMVYRTGWLNTEYGEIWRLYVNWRGQANTTFTAP